MDKHQRKQLSRWEQKKSKSERQFQERMLQSTRHNAWADVYRAVDAYEPPPSILFPRARALALTLPPTTNLGLRLEMWFDWEPWVILDRRGRITYDDDVDVAAEIASRKERKIDHKALRLAFTLMRHQTRVNAIREDLLDRTQRLRVIQECRYGFKEELMQVVWHPSRVGRILETYGWDVLDNLMGVDA